MARPRQAILSRQRIVAEAIRILDVEGLAALSTRRLARELNVRAPSLYNHFATKDEILDAIAEIGAAMRYFVAGSALGSFALGFVDDPAVYADRYPHLSGAHRLREHRERVDEGAFELGLTTLVSGFVTLYESLGLSPTGSRR